eukprot:c20728_g1_i2 orf=183-1157(-)
MATIAKFEEGNFSYGVLPPLTELFLEIQINKLIKEYLFSSTADKRPTSLYDGENGSSEFKENKAWFTPPDQLYTKNAVMQGHLHMQSLQEPPSFHSFACAKDKNSNVKDQMVPGNARRLHVSNAVCDASVVMESEGNTLHKASHLSRVDTFRCARKAELLVGAPFKADTEAKTSCKKPPRPPRFPKLPSNELGSSLTRCSSDAGTHMPSSRRIKLERKRKATAASTVSTSVWALLFTLCFAVIMIAQGFLSQDSQGYATYGTDASSPMEIYMKASALVTPWEATLAVVEGGQTSIEGVPAQSYVMRKVRAQHPSDMKRLELVKA